MDFQIDIPFEKTTNADGSLELFGGIASSSAIDRDTERMAPNIMEKIASDLRQNTTVFLNHDTKGLAMGKVTSSENKDGKVFIKVAPTKAAGMADAVLQVKEGLLKSFSIGGKIKKYSDSFNEKLGKTVRTIEDVEVHEVSVVGVPSNPEATVQSYFAKSFDSEKTGGSPVAATPPTVAHGAVSGAEAKAVEQSQVNGTPAAAAADAHAATATAQEGKLATTPLAHHDIEVVKMMKCGRCGGLTKATFSAKPEPEGGPGELSPEGNGYYKMTKAPKGDLEREEEEKKKSFDVKFTKMVNDVRAELATEFTTRESELKKEIAAGQARIELLQKAVDEKGKSFHAELDEMQKSVESKIQKDAKPEEPAGSFLKSGMTPKSR